MKSKLNLVRAALLSLSTAVPFLLSGCAFTSTGSGSSKLTTANTAATGFGGALHGGQQPIVNAAVTLWAAGTTGTGSANYGANATQVATTTTDLNGNFTFNNPTSQASPCTVGQYLYITATGGQVIGTQTNSSVAMMAAIPQPCNLSGSAPTASQFVNVNEVTTVAAVWSLQQFMKIAPGGATPWQIGAPSTNVVGLANAFLMSSSLVNLATGLTATSSTSNAVTSTVGGVTYTTVVGPDYKKINTLADILAACINTAGPSAMCSSLFADVTPGGATAPTDTLQAAYYLATNPAGLTMPSHGNAAGSPNYLCTTYPAGTGAPFQPTSTCSAIYEWTISVSWKATNASAATVGTLDAASVAIDGAGNIWVGAGNGFTTGAVNKFNPLGQVLIAPVTSVNIPAYNLNYVVANSGTLLAYPGATGVSLTYGRPFSLALDTSGNAWFTSFTVQPGTLTNGATSVATGLITEVSSSGSASGFLAGLSAGPVTVDASNNVYISDLFASGGKYYFSELVPTSSPAYQTINEGNGRTSTIFNQGAVDGAGYAYAFQTPSSCTSAVIQRVNTSQESAAAVAPTTTSTSIVLPSQCASYGAPDAAGNVWVTSATGNLSYINISTGVTAPTITNVTGSTQTSITGTGGTGGLDLPVGVAVDGVGNIWAVNRLASSTQGANGISELIPATSGTTTTVTALSPSAAGAFGFGSGAQWAGANGAAIDPSGNVWIMTTAGSYLNYLVGAAAPVATPLAQQAATNTIGVRP